jgi:hypothetical protein
MMGFSRSGRFLASFFITRTARRAMKMKLNVTAVAYPPVEGLQGTGVGCGVVVVGAGVQVVVWAVVVVDVVVVLIGAGGQVQM